MGVTGVSHERLLREGRLAVVPTDTVYGVGCAAYLAQAVGDLYALKERPVAQPTALVLGSVEVLLRDVLPELLGRTGVLCRRVFPGPVTLVVANPGRRFAHLCGDDPARIGVRVPVLTADVATLADSVGGLALTSANLRGRPAPRLFAEVSPEVVAACAFAIDGGELRGSPSCVIDITGPEPVVLRDAPDAPAQLHRLTAS